MNRVVTSKLLASVLALLAGGCGSVLADSDPETTHQTTTSSPPGSTQSPPVAIDEGFNLVGAYSSSITFTVALVQGHAGEPDGRRILPRQAVIELARHARGSG